MFRAFGAAPAAVTAEAAARIAADLLKQDAATAATDAELAAAFAAKITTGTHAARLAAAHVANRLWKETDTGLIYLDDGAAWTVWKSDGTVRKTAQQNVRNNATLANDAELLFPIEANEVWWVEAILDLTPSSLNADWKFGWSVPSGGYKTNLLTNAGGVSTASTAASASTTSVQEGAAAANQLFILVAQIANGATPGTAYLQRSQNSQTDEDSFVNVNSFLRLRRLA